jgi:UDP-3-O-[3-hydroxymyristoyl] glucosamine N-acyltransferase
MSHVFTLEYLADHVGGELKGNASVSITGLSTLQTAGSQELSFLANPAYEKYLADSKAGAVIVSPKVAEENEGNFIVHDNPYLAYARLTHLWDSTKIHLFEGSNIHPKAIVHESAKIGEGVFVGAGAVIGEGVSIESGAVIGENATISKDSIIGEATRLYPGVHVYHGVSIGKRCIIHSGVVIGSDGFGFAPNQEGWEKIVQLGGVVIEDDVEIGANSAIDRGALDNTVIESGVKLDNQIQIAHNVRVGKNTAMAACCAVAGSTTIGKNCVIGGASGIAGHLTITDNVHITAMTMVIKSLNEPGVYSSGTGVQPNAQWRKSIARLRQLDKMAGRVKALEKIVADK